MPKQRAPDQTGIITSKVGRVGGAELSGGSGLSELSGIARSGDPAVVGFRVFGRALAMLGGAGMLRMFGSSVL